jgi:cell volume regulation protein A
MGFDLFFVAAAVLLILSVIASKISDRLGIPAMLLFLILGMLAGSDGPGGIYFDDPNLAQAIGAAALMVILFSGVFPLNGAPIR